MYMKRLIVLMILSSLLFSSVYTAETEKEDVKIPSLYNALRINYFAMNYADFIGTTFVRSSCEHNFIELNPIMSFSVEKPMLGIVLVTGLSVLQYSLLGNLYKKNKTMAWITVAAITALKAYVLLHNIRELR